MELSTVSGKRGLTPFSVEIGITRAVYLPGSYQGFWNMQREQVRVGRGRPLREDENSVRYDMFIY